MEDRDAAYLFNSGRSYEAYNFLGAHPTHAYDQDGYVFRVWAPEAKAIYLVGSFNDWDSQQQLLEKHEESGIWEGFRSDVKAWDRYQYFVVGKDGTQVYKADPFSVHQETRPGTASIIYPWQDMQWTDGDFLASRPQAREAQALNIYEVHLGSWRLYENGAYYNYQDIAPQLAEYCQKMGYNAVELLPITEYPLDASWGYQVLSYFAPTSRYGTPDDFKHFINILHAAGIRVILDWVPAHFPRDAAGLFRFDGTPCFEYADPRLGEQKSWGTMVFDFGRAEVRSFLYSSAFYWLHEFHLDGLRVDAVSSMLYLDYARTDAVRNVFGGNDNLDAIDFLRELNQLLARHFPQALIIAEESTAYPRISARVEDGGLGFTHKWNMGWMHDTLDYFSCDYYARGNMHNRMTFSMSYAFSENYILPYSHDEVVHGKKSLIGRMPGDIWRQCASLRTCFVWQIGHPGGKLNFMGNEFGQFIEWRDHEELEWFMLEHPQHQALQDFSAKLNHLYLQHPSLWADDHSWNGFRWIKTDDRKNSVFAFLRTGGGEVLFFIYNLTPATLPVYDLYLPSTGRLTLLLNSDDKAWGGSGYLGDSSEGLVKETTPKTKAAYAANLEKRKKQMKKHLSAIKFARDAFQLRKEELLRAYQVYYGDLPVPEAERQAIDTPLPPLPRFEPGELSAKLTLTLPPLSAMIFRFEER